MKSITTKVKTDLLVPNMVVRACFTFTNALLCTDCLCWPGWEERDF